MDVLCYVRSRWPRLCIGLHLEAYGTWLGPWKAPWNERWFDVIPAQGSNDPWNDRNFSSAVNQVKTMPRTWQQPLATIRWLSDFIRVWVALSFWGKVLLLLFKFIMQNPLLYVSGSIHQGHELFSDISRLLRLWLFEKPVIELNKMYLYISKNLSVFFINW